MDFKTEMTSLTAEVLKIINNRKATTIVCGFVTDHQSNPIGAAKVMLDDRSYTQTAKNGKFIISDITPGTYYISIEINGEVFQNLDVINVEKGKPTVVDQLKIDILETPHIPPQTTAATPTDTKTVSHIPQPVPSSTKTPPTPHPTEAEISKDILKERDYYLLIDLSGSMITEDCPEDSSRFHFVKETTLAFVTKIINFDPDGITVITFANQHQIFDNIKSRGQIDEIFRKKPAGGTFLATPLQWVFDRYLKEKKQGNTKQNGSYIIIITDGAAEDKADVKKAISAFSQQLDNQTEIGLLFLRIGNDESAIEFLNELDIALKPPTGTAKYDIVSVSTIEEVDSITKALISAFTPNS